MRTSSFVRAALLLVSASFVWASCGGTGFEPASKIKGLRVLALQKQPAYPHPGETVELKLLYFDGKVSDANPRKLELNFFQCDNPPADLYYGCFSRLGPLSESSGVDAGAGGPSDGAPASEAGQD